MMVKLPKTRKFFKGTYKNFEVINAEHKFVDEDKKIEKEITDTTILRSSVDFSYMEFVLVEEKPKVRSLVQ